MFISVSNNIANEKQLITQEEKRALYTQRNGNSLEKRRCLPFAQSKRWPCSIEASFCLT